MKVKLLELKAFGPFTGNNIEFSDSSGVIDLVRGPNEAGKTSMLRAVSGVLFGIPHNTGDAFIHPTRSLKIGAELRGSSGGVMTVYRRKGNQNTLLDASGDQVDEAILKALLGDIDRYTFELMFGLDHDRLREGGLEILAGRGEAGMSLLQAGAGIAGLRKVLNELEAEADSLFRPRGSSQLINAALGRLRQLRDQTREDSLSSDRWMELSREVAEVEAKVSHASTRVSDLQAERATADRIRRILPLAARRAELLAELEELRDAPDLREKARDERIEVMSEIASGNQRRDRAQEQIDQLSAELDSICVDPAVLRASAQIEDASAQRALMHKNAHDLSKREIEQREQIRQCEAILAAMGFTAAIEKAGELIPPNPVMNAIRHLIREHATLMVRRDGAGDEVKRLETRLIRERDTRARAAVAPDTSVLEAMILDATKAGPLEHNLAKLKAQVQRERSAFDRMLSALGLFRGSAAILESLPVPPFAAVERFAEAHREQQEKLKDANRKIDELEEQVQQTQRNLEALRRAGEIATEHDVIQSRQRRDHGWSLICRAYIDAHEDVSAEAVDFSGGMSLPRAYESAVDKADQLADLLRGASTRAAQIMTLEQRLEEDRQAQIRLVQRLAQVKAEGHSLGAEWQRLWDPAGITPLQPIEMAQWLHKRTELVDKFSVLNSTEDSIRVLQDDVNRCRAQLEAALASVDKPPAPNQTLAAIVSFAQAILKGIGEAHLERSNLEASINGVEADLAMRRTELETVVEKLNQWRLDWLKATQSVTRDGDSTPAEIETLLNQFEALREVLSRLGASHRQVIGIRKDLNGYCSLVAELSRAVAPECADLDPAEAAHRMAAKLAEMRRALEHRDQLGERLETVTAEKVNAEAALARGRAILDRLCYEAGCSAADELPVAEQRAARKYALTERVQDAERQILEGGDGKRLAELIAEVQDRQIDEVVGRLSEIETELQLLNAECTELGARRAILSRDLDMLSRGGAAAAQAAQDAELEAASVAADAARYTQLKLAAALLSSAVERYRKRNQGPILGRASQIFKRLTVGSFTALEVEVDDRDLPVVIGVRPGGVTVNVAGMSNGTRDQLFLALRVAAVEHYVVEKGPMPFIADDLLVDFDDQRAMAALEILSELSERTQVLFLTHHDHIVRLAEKVLAPTRLKIHDLVGPLASLPDQRNSASAASARDRLPAIAK